MSVFREEFLRRAGRIPAHGLGLSVDVYQPDLFELLAALKRESVACDYLEVFRAAPPAVEAVRGRLPGCFLECHAEGLWMTQPDWFEAYPALAEIDAVAGQLRSLGSQWVTHECAAKQMAGYSFGTYLPPLLTKASVEVTAGNSLLLQDRFDRLFHEWAPLLLLEMPPLTYFACGELSISEFFRELAGRTSCGLVLDIGHLWTVFRYAGYWRRQALRDFVAQFLDGFPLERVIQIHVAGLAPHETHETMETVSAEFPAGRLPWWIDAHGAPIPGVLLEMLDQVLAHPGLTQLRGLALEVDTKALSDIVRELRQFRRRFESRFHDPAAPWNQGGESLVGRSPAPSAVRAAAGEGPHPQREALRRQYEDYARMACGHIESGLPLAGEVEGLRVYQRRYLPHEILRWGGDLREMFPAACRELDRAGVAVDGFVDFWFRSPRETLAPYDFFLLKLERFAEFAAEAAPAAGRAAAREADDLRAAYRSACDLETPA